MTHDDLEQQLHDLAERVDVPAAALEDDLDRGRRRLRRTRLLTSAAAALAVACVAGGVGVAAGAGDDTRATKEYAGSATATPSATPTATPTPSLAPADPGEGVALPPRAQRHELLRGYRDVIAKHLDPAGEHLAPWSMSNGQQSVASRDRLSGIGTKLSWTNAGESGLGMVQVFVSDSWANQFDWYCGGGCRDVPAPAGAEHARVHEHDGVTEVGVQHADGTVVVLRVDALFGNNSVVPVSGIDLAVDDLVATAADERLALP